LDQTSEYYHSKGMQKRARLRNEPDR